MNNETNTKQNAETYIYRATGRQIDYNGENAAFQTVLNKYKTNKIAVTNVAQQKGVTLTGITADKTISKQPLCQLAANIAGVISAYASANHNETLKQEMNLPVTTLMRTCDEALAPRCQNVHDKAAANRAALNDYGIKPEQLTDLQPAIDNYSAETMKPRTAVSNRKTATANLAALFKETDDILKNQMDKLIELHRADHPDFVNTYFETRIIVDPPTRATQLKGKIITQSGGQPIKNASVEIIKNGINALTNLIGEYCINPAPIGKFTIRVKAVGFQDLEIDEIEIKLGEVKKLNLILQ